MLFAKKSLGQNFLVDTNYVRRIVDTGNLSADSTVLEIGPGTGLLTEELLKREATVIAIEKDSRAIPLLQEKFKEYIAKNKFILKEGDILEEGSMPNELPDNFSIIANIPYYITGAILRKVFAMNPLPESVTLLVQEEVADRIVARDGKQSLMSLGVKCFGTPKKLFTIPPGAFRPSPKIHSAVIQITNISNMFLEGTDQELFWKIAHAGFGKKRKRLMKNIIDDGFSKEKVTKAFETLNLDTNIRAEDLEVQIWGQLTRLLAE